MRDDGDLGDSCSPTPWSSTRNLKGLTQSHPKRSHFRSVSSVSISGKVWVFRSRAMTAILAALCLCPSARHPPPIRPLLKTKVKVPFDRPVTERSKRFSPVFQGSNRGQFQPCFRFFSVRSAEGRNQVLPKNQVLNTNYRLFWLTASC
jgi:hypothetical protein